MSDCHPEICGALGKRDGRMFKAHLEFLKIPIPDLGEDTLVDAYIAAGYSGKSRVGAYAGASKLHSSAKMQMSLDWHRKQAAAEFSEDREEALGALRTIFKKGAKAEASAGDAVRAVATMAKIAGWNAPVEVDFTDLTKRAAAGDASAVDELERMAGRAAD